MIRAVNALVTFLLNCSFCAGTDIHQFRRMTILPAVDARFMYFFQLYCYGKGILKNLITFPFLDFDEFDEKSNIEFLIILSSLSF